MRSWGHVTMFCFAKKKILGKEIERAYQKWQNAKLEASGIKE